ncbi:MAG: hypothetical protein Q4E53_10370 [Eubacteriales bacterium]|nr:hypothetical protein [Eubacteriales bacterium]
MNRTKKIIIRLTKREQDKLNEYVQDYKDPETGQKGNVSAYLRNCAFSLIHHPDEISQEIRKVKTQMRKVKVQSDVILKKAKESDIYEMDIVRLEKDLKAAEKAMYSMEAAFDRFRDSLEE